MLSAPHLFACSSLTSYAAHAKRSTDILCGCRAVVGEVDEDVDQGLDLSAIRAAPVKPLQH